MLQAMVHELVHSTTYNTRTSRTIVHYFDHNPELCVNEYLSCLCTTAHGLMLCLRVETGDFKAHTHTMAISLVENEVHARTHDT
jgi:hypothetical protein